MSRSGYSDEGDNLNLWRATVERSIAGKKGQAFLRELAKEMDAMPHKRLIADELVAENGEMCAIGVVCKARGLDTKGVNIENPKRVGELVGISMAMAAEIEYENDERTRSEWRTDVPEETPENRWIRMRKWVDENLKG